MLTASNGACYCRLFLPLASCSACHLPPLGSLVSSLLSWLLLPLLLPHHHDDHDDRTQTQSQSQSRVQTEVQFEVRPQKCSQIQKQKPNTHTHIQRGRERERYREYAAGNDSYQLCVCLCGPRLLIKQSPPTKKGRETHKHTQKIQNFSKQHQVEALLLLTLLLYHYIYAES